MFWTTISGFLWTEMPEAAICFATRSIAVLTFSRLFAPVPTTLPLRNSRIAVFGSLSRKINPGNCSGSYSAPPRTRAIAWRSSSSPRDVDATTFSILMFAKDTPSWAGGGVPAHRLRPDAGSPLFGWVVPGLDSGQAICFGRGALWGLGGLGGGTGRGGKGGRLRGL